MVDPFSLLFGDGLVRHFVFAPFSEPTEIELALFIDHVAIFKRCDYLLC